MKKKNGEKIENLRVTAFHSPTQKNVSGGPKGDPSSTSVFLCVRVELFSQPYGEEAEFPPHCEGELP